MIDQSKEEVLKALVEFLDLTFGAATGVSVTVIVGTVALIVVILKTAVRIADRYFTAEAHLRNVKVSEELAARETSSITVERLYENYSRDLTFAKWAYLSGWYVYPLAVLFLSLALYAGILVCAILMVTWSWWFIAKALFLTLGYLVYLLVVVEILGWIVERNLRKAKLVSPNQDDRLLFWKKSEAGSANEEGDGESEIVGEKPSGSSHRDAQRQPFEVVRPFRELWRHLSKR
ncbi:hypothetical protein M5J20_11075 [Corynebacterium sp. TA-R-1]|uniref:DUF4282 domain-containing protein n=1 Tax=Corynebacterium stercoris TaxID=2943490 RepID=A0ABT1G3X6_9CORY|nr:hypothetical protein [Corynebacterium stercoris]MCP1388716.1 hypothetical protein [Corynebacterium stercoris]